MDSILSSVKKFLGIVAECTDFDQDIIMHINSVFTILEQLGAGPDGGFTISDDTAVWSDFLGDCKQIEIVKSYMYMKVRMMFDPPLSSAVSSALESNISEMEFRINVAVENGKLGG